jgi:hypothetical protein
MLDRMPQESARDAERGRYGRAPRRGPADDAPMAAQQAADQAPQRCDRTARGRHGPPLAAPQPRRRCRGAEHVREHDQFQPELGMTGVRTRVGRHEQDVGDELRSELGHREPLPAARVTRQPPGGSGQDDRDQQQPPHGWRRTGGEHVAAGRGGKGGCDSGDRARESALWKRRAASTRLSAGGHGGGETPGRVSSGGRRSAPRTAHVGPTPDRQRRGGTESARPRSRWEPPWRGRYVATRIVLNAR